MANALEPQDHQPAQAGADLVNFLDRARAVEFERACRSLAGGRPAAQVLEQFARGLTNKFLHVPTQVLNRAGAAERAEFHSLLNRIYRLPDTSACLTHKGPHHDHK